MCAQRWWNFSRWINSERRDIYLVFHHCDRNMCFLCVWFIFRELAIVFDRNRRIYEFLTLPKKRNEKFVTFCRFYQLQRCNLLQWSIPAIEMCRDKVFMRTFWLMLEDFRKRFEFKFYCLWLYRIFKWCGFADQSRKRPESFVDENLCLEYD